MTIHCALLCATTACLLGIGAAFAQTQQAPAWAYPVNPPGQTAQAPEANASRRVPNSSAMYTNAQVDDLFFAPDWHPDEHPAAPLVVARGRAPVVYACGYCHRITGSGGPENARLAGLPYSYIVQQLSDFRTGARSTMLPMRVPQAFMIASAKALTRGEVEEAAAYFSKLRPSPNIRVVEVTVVPRTHVEGWRLAAGLGSGTEAIGDRIVELPDRVEFFESRDSHATFTAYVPPGSVARGRALSQLGNAAHITACVSCHGPLLEGTSLGPPLAGQSPTYLVRQLNDIKNGARSGSQLGRMKSVASSLKPNEIIAVAAYAASVSP